MSRFLRALCTAVGSRSFAYVWVPEWQKAGHGLHMHLAVGEFISRSKIDLAWGDGFVHIKRLSVVPVGSTSLHETRPAASYLSKYVTKTSAAGAAGRLAGMHCSEIAQGFQSAMVGFMGAAGDDVFFQAVAQMGGVLPGISLSSSENEDWRGQPAVWFAWD